MSEPQKLYHGTHPEVAIAILRDGFDLRHFGGNTRQTPQRSPAGRAVSLTPDYQLATNFATHHCVLEVELAAEAKLLTLTGADIVVDPAEGWNGQSYQRRLRAAHYDGVEWALDSGWREINVFRAELITPLRVVWPEGIARQRLRAAWNQAYSLYFDPARVRS